MFRLATEGNLDIVRRGVASLSDEIDALRVELERKIPTAAEAPKIVTIKVWFDREGKRMYEGLYTGELAVFPYASMSGRGFKILDKYGVQIADHQGDIQYEIVEAKTEQQPIPATETPSETMTEWMLSHSRLQLHNKEMVDQIESINRCLEFQSKYIDKLELRVIKLEAKPKRK